jgi:hypothetical protein
MIIDHLMRFDTEDAAKADPVVGAYFSPADSEGSGAWRGDVCIPNVSVYALDGENHVPFSGWYVVIALPALSEALRDIPGNACRLIADRDAADRGERFMRYVAADLSPGDLASAHVEPLFAGSGYPFGVN